MATMLNSLGATLAQVINRDAMVCRGLLRLTIIDSAEDLWQTSDYGQIMTNMKTMGYEEWKQLIEGQAFTKRLQNIGIQETATVVNNLRQTLVEQQSLFTMTAL